MSVALLQTTAEYLSYYNCMEIMAVSSKSSNNEVTVLISKKLDEAL